MILITWKIKLISRKVRLEGNGPKKVFQVDDGPGCISCSGTWVHVDGKSYWESTTPAPLPRRERDIRNDYNLTIRGNRVEIMDYGWAHIRKDNSKNWEKKINKLLQKKKGYNTYKSRGRKM